MDENNEEVIRTPGEDNVEPIVETPVEPTVEPATETTNNSVSPKMNNKAALASFILSLVGLIIAGIPCGIAAFITGIIGITKFDESKEKNKWMAIFGLVLGIIDVVVVAVALPTIYKQLGIMQ